MNITKITDIRLIIASSKACNVSSKGCTLEAKFGRVVLDFSKYNDAHKITLQIKRLSGNGKVIIAGVEEVIASKTNQNFEVSGPIVEITRPHDGTGEINIFAATIYIGSERKDILANWKALINRCGEYRCLRVVGDRLFASEGAFIGNGNVIKHIKTSPSNVTKMSDDGKLVFITSCEILDLVVDGSAPLAPAPTQLYAQREAPTPLVVPSEQSPHQPPSIPPQQNVSRRPEPKNKFMEQFVYDSNSTNEFSLVNKRNTKTVKFVKSNGVDYLILQRGGSYSIPCAFSFQPGHQYIAIITAKKLNGNGKLSVYTDSTKEETVVLENQFKEFAIVLKVGESTTSLNLAANEIVSLGEMLISRVRILLTDSNYTYATHYFLADSLDMRVQPAQTSQWISGAFKRRFVIVIPSYKNVQWCDRNITSTINQNYDQYRVIYTDDDSPDGTFEKVQSIVDQSSKKDKFTLIKNTVRVGALANLYNMIHSCDDDEIILTLDGDDWLAGENVLNVLNDVYSGNDVWMTYGQYQNHPDGGKGVAQPIPNNVIQSGSFRRHTWCSTHLRTFYSWLFKSIRKNDLFYDGNFMSMTWDMAMMFPMLEMSGHRSKYIDQTMYIYNMENPINDHKVNVQLQQNLDRYVRSLPPYNKLARSNINFGSIGLMLIATGKYHEFIQGLISSADSYFLRGENVTYYLFSDRNHNIKTDRAVVQIHIDHRPFPFASMDRFKHFTNSADLLCKEKYLFYVDVDCLFVDYVGPDILGNLVGVRHCGFMDKLGPIETNEKSVFYFSEQDMTKYKAYFGGGFSGGRSEQYLQLSRWCYDNIESDVSNGVIPTWHDETAINRYFLDHPPDVMLSPSYHYPQSDIERYKRMWKQDFKPKIMLLDKNHSQVR